MNSLVELIETIERNKLKSIELQGGRKKSNRKFDQLYEGIRKGEITNDEEAIELLYGTDLNEANLQKLKYRLKRRLLNSIFFIDVKKPLFNDFRKAYYNCYKNYAAIKILFGRTANRNAVDLAKKTLRQALKYEITEVVVYIARMLRLYYANAEGNRRLINKYNELFHEQMKIYERETYAEELFYIYSADFINSKSVNDQLREQIAQITDQLSAIKDLPNNFSFYKIYYMANSLKYELSYNYASVLETCTDAIDFFEQKKYSAVSYRVIIAFYLKQMTCCLMLGKHEKGKNIFYKSIKLVETGTPNWFNRFGIYLLLTLHSQDFDTAYDVFMKVTKNNRFKYQFQNVKETWKIYEAYLYYFMKMGRFSEEKTEELKSKKFRLGKFLNEVPVFSKDKRGSNISILIIQILVLLHRKKYTVIIDRMESLKMYCARYLKQDANFRSNCFIKMLMQLPVANFHKVAVIRKTKTYTERLKLVPLEKAKQDYEIEIVPYEILWDCVLDSLQDKAVNLKK